MNAVKIPVIANGGVFCAEDGEKLLAETGADGIAVARGAMYALKKRRVLLSVFVYPALM